MTNTKKSFEDKWQKNRDLAFNETLREGSEIFNWILNRNGFKNGDELRNFLSDKRRILDAGCGNGRVTALLRKYSNPDTTEIVAVDLVAASVAEENLRLNGLDCNVQFFKKDLLDSLDDLGDFDFIYCQEVLHHTSDPEKAFNKLAKLLRPGGEIAIYVYKKKAPVREFVDDYIREKISDLPYEEAIKTCDQITELGKTLSECELKIKVPQVDILDIKEGEYDMQRFIYHFFMKCFWNPDLSFEDNSVINYDWYHPQLCSRHTLDEVREWLVNAELKVTREFVDFYGITVSGKK